MGNLLFPLIGQRSLYVMCETECSIETGLTAETELVVVLGDRKPARTQEIKNF
jgi:hypothetical protein